MKEVKLYIYLVAIMLATAILCTWLESVGLYKVIFVVGVFFVISIVEVVKKNLGEK